LETFGSFIVFFVSQLADMQKDRKVLEILKARVTDSAPAFGLNTSASCGFSF
jgi:hypothetical protein